MAIIFHIDVNSAFLSWTAVEKLRQGSDLDLRLVPSIIGGDEANRHGIVLAKSTPAKSFGIHTAEPVASALKKCPFLKIEPPDRALYSRRSAELMDFLASYTPDLEQLSVDECFMDFTPIAAGFPSPTAAADEIRRRVREELGFTVNVGISVNRLLAKMASDFEKPDRTHTLFPEEIPEKMWPLPVSDLFMVGRSSASRLQALGIQTIGDLAVTDPALLELHFKSHGRQMWNYANGIASSQVRSQARERKGVGNSVTLPKDVTDREDALRILLQLCEKVCSRLREKNSLAGSVSVEIKYNDFTSCSHQAPLSPETATTDLVYQAVCRLFDELWNGSPIRLLGVRTTHLADGAAPRQLTIFDLISEQEDTGAELPEQNKKGRIPVSPEKMLKMDRAVDLIRKKYGKNAVTRGSLSGKKEEKE